MFRPVNRGCEVRDTALSEKVVLQLIQAYAEAAGVAGIAPHDCRRTCAKLCRAAGGELEQIQMLPGHASVQTTERYLGTKQDLVHAPNDGIKQRVAIVAPPPFSKVWTPARCPLQWGREIAYLSQSPQRFAGQKI
jgi:integrase